MTSKNCFKYNRPTSSIRLRAFQIFPMFSVRWRVGFGPKFRRKNASLCDALSYLLDNIYIRFGTKLYRQIVRIPMGTNCAPLVADLFLYCYERDFKDSLNHDNQADVIEAFNSTSRYLDDLLNIDSPYFEGMVNQIYPPELQLNKVEQSQYLRHRSPLFRSTSFCCKWICFF